MHSLLGLRRYMGNRRSTFPPITLPALRGFQYGQLMKVNTRMFEVSTMAGYCSYKSGELVRRRESSVLRCLPCCFLLLVFVCSWLPFLTNMMDRGEYPWKDVPKARICHCVSEFCCTNRGECLNDILRLMLT